MNVVFGDMEKHNQLWLLELTKNVKRAYVKDAVLESNRTEGKLRILQMIKVVNTHSQTGDIYCLMSDAQNKIFVRFSSGKAMTRYVKQYQVPFVYSSTHMLVLITKAHLRQYSYAKLMKVLLFECNEPQKRFINDTATLFDKSLNYVVMEVEDFQIYSRLGTLPLNPFRTFIYLHPSYKGKLDFTEAMKLVKDDEGDLLEEGEASTYHTIAYPTTIKN